MPEGISNRRSYILHLQRILGNDAVAYLWRTGKLQKRLGLDQAKYPGQPIQRAEKQEEEIKQAPIQRAEKQEEEAGLQTSSKPAKSQGGLPASLKTGLEELSGIPLDHVKVHYNSPEPAKIQAHAYTQDSEIHVAPGREKHLPHEGWHVVQQTRGRVKPTMQMREAKINNDATLEKEADVMGARAAGAGNKAPTSVSPKAQRHGQNSFSIVSPTSASPAIQRAKQQPAEGNQIKYLGRIWTVIISGRNNPQITIRENPDRNQNRHRNHAVRINWRNSNFTILRENNNNDFDLRENDPGALIPINEYAGLSSLERTIKKRKRFHEAKLKALEMIKATVLREGIDRGDVESLNAIHLLDFIVSKRGYNLTGAGKLPGFVAGDGDNLLLNFPSKRSLRHRPGNPMAACRAYVV